MAKKIRRVAGRKKSKKTGELKSKMHHLQLDSRDMFFHVT